MSWASRTLVLLLIEDQGLDVGEHQVRVEEVQAVDVAALARGIDQEGAKNVIQRAPCRGRIRLGADSLAISSEYGRERRSVRRRQEVPLGSARVIGPPACGILRKNPRRVMIRVKAHRDQMH